VRVVFQFGITVKPGVYESELYEILDYTNFLPGPGEIPSYTLKVWVVRNSELGMFSAVPCDSYNPGLTVYLLHFQRLTIN